jgi:phosphoglycerate dehydrogenase-like enzyme
MSWQQGSPAMVAVPLRVHVQNPLEDDHDNLKFAITEKIWADAVARNAAASGGLTLSIGWTPADFTRMIRDADFMISWTAAIKAAFAHQPVAPRLKFILAASAGLDRLAPFDWLPPGVKLCNNSGTHATKAGEYGMMALLMLNAALPQFAGQQRDRRYEKVFTPMIAGKTVVIVGLGNIGGAVAARARSFGMNVIGVRTDPAPHADCTRVVGTGALDAVLPEADFVLLSLPLTPATRGMFTRARLNRMKSTAGLVNMARGLVIDQDALCDKLDRGELSGAVLDVFVPEPVPAESRLWTTRNLIMTPHVSSDDLATYIPTTLDIFFRNLSCWRRGEALPNAIDPKLGY